MNLIDQIIAPENLQAAMQWLESRRKDSHLNNGDCAARDFFHVRLMDDWVLLCRTRNQLRTIVRIMHKVLDAVKQTKHPYKTFIGKIPLTGFDFLGYRIGNRLLGGLTIAWTTWANHQGKLRQLYEQGAPETRIGQYVERWQPWGSGGLKETDELILGRVEREFQRELWLGLD